MPFEIKILMDMLTDPLFYGYIGFGFMLLITFTWLTEKQK